MTFFQLADTLEQLRNLPVTLLEAGVNFFSPLVHASGPAAPGLKQSSMAVQTGSLSVESTAHFVETLVDPGKAILHEREERFPQVTEVFFPLCPHLGFQLPEIFLRCCIRHISILAGRAEGLAQPRLLIEPSGSPRGVEVASLIGSITLQNGKPVFHAHTVLGFGDGSTTDDHFVAGHVLVFMEVYIVDTGQ